MIMFGIVPVFLHRNPFSVVAAMALLAQQMTKRSRPFTDEASKDTGASSRPTPQGKRVLSLAAVRHPKSSLLISSQEKTRSTVKSQENPREASGDRLHFPGPTRNPEVTEPER